MADGKKEDRKKRANAPTDIWKKRGKGNVIRRIPLERREGAYSLTRGKWG